MSQIHGMGIYCITHKSSGKKYIGSAVRIARRWIEHRCHLRNGTHHAIKLQNSWNKYGEAAFSFEVLEIVLSPDQLVPAEQRWFDQERPIFNSTLTAGSCLGFKHSAETRKKVSEALRKRAAPSAETRAKLSKAKKGIPLSPEHRLKMIAIQRNRSPEWRANISKAKKGTKFTDEQKARMGAAHRGLKHSEESKKRISDAHKGRPKSAEHRAAMSVAAKRREELKRLAKEALSLPR